jgi:5-methylcytosine-specific restriction protein A
MTARSTNEWIGTTPDTPVPDRVRVRVFDRDGGRCQCGCGRKVMAGESWDTDHKIALVNGGENRESNLTTLLTEHHKSKTRRDVAIKSKTYRMRKRHLGIRKPSRFPGARNSPLKKKMDGTVVLR